MQISIFNFKMTMVMKITILWLGSRCCESPGHCGWRQDYRCIASSTTTSRRGRIEQHAQKSMKLGER